MDNPLSAEDTKLITLARATRARVGADQGAAVRDRDGRTYAAATVELPSLRLSAVQVCVAMAYASGSSGLEAAVALGTHGDSAEGELAEADLAVLRDFAGGECLVHLTDPKGTVITSQNL
jgi:hypothetical protein